MNRRQLVTLLAGTAATTVSKPWPLAAQQGASGLRLGVLLYGSPQTERQMVTVLRVLRQLGYVEGRNLAIDYRYGEGNTEQLPRLALELVNGRPDILLAFGGDVAPFVRAATRTIPIVFAVSADPARLGLVDSLGRPGGNATGVTYLQDELAGKRVQILNELAPHATRMAFLWNPDHPDNELREATRAAQSLNIQIRPFPVRNAGDLAGAFQAISEARSDAVYAVSSRLTVVNIEKIGGFAAEKRLILAGGWGAWAEAGALLSYGPNVNEMIGRAAEYVGKIHQGAKPAELPVEQPSRFALIVNLKVAKALDLAIPDALLTRADEVIE